MNRGLVHLILCSTLVAVAVGPSVASAATASWHFEPSSYDFGVRLPNSGPSAPAELRLVNDGEVELSVGLVAVGGAVGSGFKVVGTTCGNLLPGAACTFEVSFDPSTGGPHGGDLSVGEFGGQVGPAVVNLSGTGAGPIVRMSTETLVFSPLMTGSGPSAAKTVTVSNSGQLDLTIAAIRMESAQSAFRTSGGTCRSGSNVEPGGSCTVEVEFSPFGPGQAADGLLISDNAPESPQRVALEGFGTPNPPTTPASVQPSIWHAPHSTTLGWRYRGTKGDSVVLARVRFDSCTEGSAPTIEPRVRELRGRAVITMIADFPSYEGDLCQKIPGWQDVEVRLRRPTWKVALFDGAHPPPQRRGPSPKSPTRH